MPNAPLILQIQSLAIDEQSSLSAALRTTKVACSKLGLKDFAQWVEKELKGYNCTTPAEIPSHRHISGRSEILHNRQWYEMQLDPAGSPFSYEQLRKGFAHVAVRDSVPHIEEAIRQGGTIRFPHDEMLKEIIAITFGADAQTSVRVSTYSIANILQGVRDILVDWTIQMEEEGITGHDMTFSDQDRMRSRSATETVVNNFHIGNIGALVQNATDSQLFGNAETSAKEN